MHHKPVHDEWVRRALRHARFEVLPTPGIEKAVLEALPRDTTVAVTASPARGLDATLDLAERLAGHGYRPVPHLAARMVRDQGHLSEIVERLVGCGVTDVFCPAGDAETPAGSYAGALGLLEDLTAMGRPFAEVGITGYPESHPVISDQAAAEAMWAKRGHATYIVSNLCFDPQTIADWVRRVRADGVELPLIVGLPGPVERTRLLSMATKIGVGQSIRFVGTHVGAVARMAAPGGFSPDRFLRKAAVALSDPALRVDGLHLFTFNQVARTQEWRGQLLA